MTDALGLSSATELAQLIRNRELSSVELLDHFVERVERINPDINAVITLDVERAKESAVAADQATADGVETGPLHGLPITVKDAIATEGIRSTGGATELAEHVPSEDAPVVSSVREAGAIVFGKTNLPRWSGDVQAYNEMFGVTGNPWDPTRTPGGSSGGASAAVSAGLTSFEIGTDIGGSVRLPAHFAGVCGHKPSFGVIPQHGYLDHVTGGTVEADVNVFGPLARTVDDLAVLVDVMAGPTADRATAWTLDLPPARAKNPADLRVAAWLDDPSCAVSSTVGALLEGAVSALGQHGVDVTSTHPDVSIANVWETGLPLISAATSPGRSDEEWEEQVRKANDPSLDPTTAMRYRASTLYHRDWLLMTERREELRKVWAEFFTHYDVLLCPVAVTEAFPHTLDGGLYSRTIQIDGSERPYADLIAWTSMIGFVYLPSTVVPVGLTPEGLPVGIQVVGPFLEDRTTLSFARLVEEVCGGYQVPPVA